MIITVFGATGTVGKHVVTQALQIGHTVKAFGRNVNAFAELKNENLILITGDVLNEEHVSAAVKGSDAVISVLGGPIVDNDNIRSRGIETIIAGMKKNVVKRIIHLGGSGLLEVPNGQMHMETDAFFKRFLPYSEEHRRAYHLLQHSGLEFTTFCPPDILDLPAGNDYKTFEEKYPADRKKNINAGDLVNEMLKAVNDRSTYHKRIGITNN